MSYKKYIRELCDKLRTHFFHGEYAMLIKYEDEDEVGHQDGYSVGAKIDISCRYLDFTITIYPLIKTYFKDKEYRKICELLCHEFCHLLTEPLYLIGVDAVTNPEQKHLEDIRERQTQRICNIIMHNLPKKFYEPLQKTIRKNI